jgi:predicted transcriptional regulator
VTSSAVANATVSTEEKTNATAAIDSEIKEAQKVKLDLEAEEDSEPKMSINSEGKPEFAEDERPKLTKVDYDFMDTLREKAHVLEEKLAKEEEQSINELQR